MNTPIVDPIIFYWLGVLKPLNDFINLIIIIQIISLTIIVINVFVNYEMAEEYGGEYLKKRDDMLKLGKKFALTFLLSVPLFIFVPSKETVMQMFVASKITPENIASSKTFVIDTVKEIKEALKDK